MKKDSRTCLECGEQLIGRSDKKFCSDSCRSNSNHRMNGDISNHIRNVNAILRRNRKILEELNPHGKAKVSGEQLRMRGFDFMHCTGIDKNREESVCIYCYDQGYQRLEPEVYLLFRKSSKPKNRS